MWCVPRCRGDVMGVGSRPAGMICVQLLPHGSMNTPSHHASRRSPSYVHQPPSWGCTHWRSSARVLASTMLCLARKQLVMCLTIRNSTVQRALGRASAPAALISTRRGHATSADAIFARRATITSHSMAPQQHDEPYRNTYSQHTMARRTPMHHRLTTRHARPQHQPLMPSHSTSPRRNAVPHRTTIY